MSKNDRRRMTVETLSGDVTAHDLARLMGLSITWDAGALAAMNDDDRALVEANSEVAPVVDPDATENF